MNYIDNDNIDDIMFQLLEGEITGLEREKLLEAIQADPEYSKLWKAWQQTVITPVETIDFDSSKLKKKTTKVVVFNFKMAIAAMVVLAIGLGLYLTLNNQGQDIKIVAESSDVKPKPKTPVIQIPPAPSNSNPLIAPTENSSDKLDSNISMKEKVRSMATNKLEPENFNTVKNKIDESIIIEDSKPHLEIVDNKPKETVIPSKPTPVNDNISVSIETSQIAKVEPNNENNKTLISRIFGSPKIKIANDSTTRTSRKLIIENNKYQIIAGF